MTIFFSVSCKSRESIFIVKDNKSPYIILLSESANKHDKNAASILQNYIKLISDVVIPIRYENKNINEPFIYIGNSSQSRNTRQIKNDGFAIESHGDNLLIYGIKGKGTLYGVYSFLEEYLGCRKLTGNEPAEIVKSNTIKIPGSILNIQNPEFIFRQSYYPASQDPEYLDWHKLHRFEDLWGLWGHSFFKIINPDHYFEDHPEYFAYSGGIRQKTQLCLSNEEVQELAFNYFKKEIKNHPDAVYWSISPMDNSSYCECEKCSKIDKPEGGPQGSLIQFVNNIAKSFPEQNFTTLAYTYTSKPPLLTKPQSNVFIFISSIDAYRTNPLSIEPSAKLFRNNLESWSAITDNIFIWDYTTQFTNFLVPFPDYNHIKDNIDFFKENHVKGVFFHGSEEYFSDMADLSSFLQARYLWNSRESIDYWKKYFVEEYYGPASKTVLSYLKELENSIQDSKSELDIYGNSILERKGYLSPKQIDMYDDFINTAHEEIQPFPLFKRRIEMLQLALEFVVLEQSKAYGTAKHGYLVYNEDLETFEVNPRWSERVNLFIEKAKEFNIYKLAEVNHTLENYKLDWYQIINKGWKNNIAKNASLSLKFPFVPEYPANGKETLIDGIEGTLDFSYNWLLFNENKMEAILDFKKEKEITQVKLGFLHDPKHYIFLPAEIEIMASDDGQNFKEIAKKSINLSIDEELEVYRKEISFPLHHFAAYYKIIATPQKKLPAWRYHNSKKPSIACDEILMK